MCHSMSYYQNCQTAYHKPPVVAVLLDAENVASTHLDFVMEKASKYGALLIRRAYADWSMSHVSSYREVLKKHAFLAIHQFSGFSGKNSSDMALSVDAMDLAYKNKPDVVVVVTSDSDFIPLVIKLREMGIHVIGVGNANVSRGLVSACHDFHYIPVLTKPASPPTKFHAGFGQKFAPKPKVAPYQSAQTKPQTTPIMPLKVGQKDPNHQSIIHVLDELIQTKADEAGRVNSALAGLAFSANNISVSDYGFEKITAMVACMRDFEVVVDNTTAYIQKRQATCDAVGHNPIVVPEDAPFNPQSLDAQFVDAVAEAIDNYQDEFGWAKVAHVAVFIRHHHGMYALQYGYKNLSQALKDSEAFELYEDPKGDYVRDVRMVTDEWVDKKPVNVERVFSDETTQQTSEQYIKHTQKAQQIADTLVAQTAQDEMQHQAVLDDTPAKHTTTQNPASQTNPQASPAPNTAIKGFLTDAQIHELRTLIHDIMQSNKDNLPWVSLSTIGVGLRKAGIEPKQLGVKNFSTLIEKMGCFETKVLNTVLCLKNPFFIDQVAKTVAEVSHAQISDDDTDESLCVETSQDTQDDVLSNDKDDVNTDDVNTDEGGDEPLNQALTKNLPSTDELLTIIDKAIDAHKNAEGYTKVGDIGKYVRQHTGLGAMSFGHADFGKMLALLPAYEVVRRGRVSVVRKQDN